MDLGDLPEVPRLDAADRLFVPGSPPGDWRGVACVNFGSPEIGYVEGFLRAADLAVQHVLKTGNDQDYLVYPIVFCYRQHLELRIKGLLLDACCLLGESLPSKELMGKHKLMPIWRMLCPLLDRIFDNASELMIVGDRLQEFEDLDPDSFAFRYATSKAGKSLLPKDLEQVNLENLRDTMQKIADMLDAADTGVKVYLDNKAEAAIYRREYES